jgi:hypothetical protein
VGTSTCPVPTNPSALTLLDPGYVFSIRQPDLTKKKYYIYSGKPNELVKRFELNPKTVSTGDVGWLEGDDTNNKIHYVIYLEDDPQGFGQIYKHYRIEGFETGCSTEEPIEGTNFNPWSAGAPCVDLLYLRKEEFSNDDQCLKRGKICLDKLSAKNNCKPGMICILQTGSGDGYEPRK